jgi:protein-S-isoprenylcysteine O-methyltransferase Ste14
MGKLILQSMATAGVGLAVFALLLFLPAGTFNYWQAWAFTATFIASTTAIGLYLSVKDPALLERRRNIGPQAEQRLPQRILMAAALLGNVGLLVFCALDQRFGWSPVPGWISVLGDVLVALGLFINLLVFRENSFGGSTVQAFEGQNVITTGPYALVRHPMYVGVLIMLAGVPLALGSWWGLAILLLAVPGLMWRITDEEKLLRQELRGYTDYAQQVHYRLLPGVW